MIPRSGAIVSPPPDPPPRNEKGRPAGRPLSFAVERRRRALGFLGRALLLSLGLGRRLLLAAVLGLALGLGLRLLGLLGLGRGLGRLGLGLLLRLALLALLLGLLGLVLRAEQ